MIIAVYKHGGGKEVIKWDNNNLCIDSELLYIFRVKAKSNHSTFWQQLLNALFGKKATLTQSGYTLPAAKNPFLTPRRKHKNG
jgi:hypothetical protein